MGRLNWNEYFMNIAVQVSLRSTCIRRKVGAVIVKDNTILSTGYNGAPKGLQNCSDCPNRCYRSAHNIPSGEKLDLCYAQHAEVNALFSALKSGTPLEGASIYVTTFPCSSCAKALIQVGIKNVYYIDNYTHDFTKMMFDEAGVNYVEMDGSVYNTPSLDGAEIVTSNNLDAIDPFISEIYKYEPGTEEFMENRHDVFKKNGLYEKYDETIAITEWAPDEEIIPFDRRGTLKGANIDEIFNISYANRADMEYTGGKKKQVVVCGLIYDPIESAFVLLKSIEGRLNGKYNLVQGHVAVDLDDTSLMNNGLHHLFAMNMAKELGEEVRGIVNPQISPLCVIQSSDNKISSEHIGVCYMIVGKIDKDNLKSGEPHKHEAVYVPTDSLKNVEGFADLLDTWCKKVIDHVTK